MDPNETLRELLKLAESVPSCEEEFQDDVARMGELIEALDGWLTKGGFLPRRWEKAPSSDTSLLVVLQQLIQSNEQLNRQVTDLQTRCTELLEEKRRANVDYAVREFHLKYRHPAPVELVIPDAAQIRFRFTLMAEEFLEMFKAAFKQSPQRPWALEQIREKLAWLIETSPVDVNLRELMHEMHDLDYTVAGTRVVFGYDGIPGAAEVHRANMDKDPNGPNGKPVKPEGWRPPDIEGVLRAQGWPREIPDTLRGRLAPYAPPTNFTLDMPTNESD